MSLLAAAVDTKDDPQTLDAWRRDALAAAIWSSHVVDGLLAYVHGLRGVRLSDADRVQEMLSRLSLVALYTRSSWVRQLPTEAERFTASHVGLTIADGLQSSLAIGGAAGLFESIEWLRSSQVAPQMAPKRDSPTPHFLDLGFHATGKQPGAPLGQPALLSVGGESLLASLSPPDSRCLDADAIRGELGGAGAVWLTTRLERGTLFSAWAHDGGIQSHSASMNDSVARALAVLNDMNPAITSADQRVSWGRPGLDPANHWHSAGRRWAIGRRSRNRRAVP